jgi:hypothetical protein
MASSVFCLALLGDGYSSRFDDAVLHGCVAGWLAGSIMRYCGWLGTDR